MSKQNGLLKKIWNNGEFTDSANKIMLMSAWCLAWLGFVVVALQGV